MYQETGQTPYSQAFQTLNLRKCWSECLERSAYRSRKAAIDQFNRDNYWKKKGIAIIPLKFPCGFCTRFLGQVSGGFFLK